MDLSANDARLVMCGLYLLKLSLSRSMKHESNFDIVKIRQDEVNAIDRLLLIVRNLSKEGFTHDL